MKLSTARFGIVLIMGLVACSSEPSSLAYYGPAQLNAQGDSVYHAIAPFQFVDQAGRAVSAETFAGGIYVADFFFTTCPDICPIIQAQLKRVWEVYKNEPDVYFLSHSLSPSDSQQVLADYAAKFGITGNSWRFVTGRTDSIYTMARNSYFTGALQDEAAPGGIAHSGQFTLVDDKGHIRGLYDGTRPEEVDRLIEEIPALLREVRARQTGNHE